MAVIDTATVARWVPQAAGNDTLIAEAIAEASALMAEAIGSVVDLAACTDYVSITGDTNVIALTNAPVVSDGTHAFTVTYLPDISSGAEIDSDLYAVNTEAGLVTGLYGNWSRGERVYKVAYYAGYTSTTFPQRLRTPLRQLIGWLLDSRGNAGTKSEGQDGYSVTYEDLERGMPVSISRMLPRRVRLG